MPQLFRQVAAVALRDGLVCLVTSRNRRRWVVPKGHVEPGQTPQETAVAEAWEEAGLRGTVDPEPLGIYHYRKRGRSHAVTVYRFNLLVEHEQWPERLQRDREWVPIDEAARRVHEMELRDLLLELASESLVLDAVAG
jgi:8-oxo-dGTP pyrophosphatase MutT (NUDIX family)